jgi:hypothetical protein
MDTAPEVKPGYAYILRREDMGLYKIGVTRRLSNLLERLHQRETESVLFCCQLYDQPLQVVDGLRKQYERNRVVCTQWYSLPMPPALPMEGGRQKSSKIPETTTDWLDRHIAKTCSGKILTASSYRSQYITRSKQHFYPKELVASRMAALADAGVLEMMPSAAPNSRGGLYYTTCVIPVSASLLS